LLQVLRVDPKDLEAMWERAAVFSELGQYKRAVEHLTQLLKVLTNQVVFV